MGRNEIARRTGIPPTTVLRWLHGQPPRFARPQAATCVTCGHPVHDAIDASSYSHLLGLYLGDGHLATFPRTLCLRIYLDRAYPGIVAGCAESIGRVLPGTAWAFGRATGARSCSATPGSRRALPQHGPGPKHTRAIVLADWQREITHGHPRELIRGLIESDGSRSMNAIVRGGRRYAYPRYSFSNRSEDIKAILCEHLDLLGIAWRRAGRFTISIARREAVAALDEFVGPKR
jgi:hypothetical protein